MYVCVYVCIYSCISLPGKCLKKLNDFFSQQYCYLIQRNTMRAKGRIIYVWIELSHFLQNAFCSVLLFILSILLYVYAISRSQPPYVSKKLGPCGPYCDTDFEWKYQPLSEGRHQAKQQIAMLYHTWSFRLHLLTKFPLRRK